MTTMRQIPYAHNALPKYRKSTWLTLNQTPLIVVSQTNASPLIFLTSLTVVVADPFANQVRWVELYKGNTFMAMCVRCTRRRLSTPVVPRCISSKINTRTQQHTERHNELNEKTIEARCDLRPPNWPHAHVYRWQWMRVHATGICIVHSRAAKVRVNIV